MAVLQIWAQAHCTEEGGPSPGGRGEETRLAHHEGRGVAGAGRGAIILIAVSGPAGLGRLASIAVAFNLPAGDEGEAPAARGGQRPLGEPACEAFDQKLRHDMRLMAKRGLRLGMEAAAAGPTEAGALGADPREGAQRKPLGEREHVAPRAGEPKRHAATWKSSPVTPRSVSNGQT